MAEAPGRTGGDARSFQPGWFAGACALIVVLAGSGLAFPGLGTANLALLFLLPVVAGAGGSGRIGGIMTALIAALAFNYVALAPIETLHVARATDLVTLVVYLAVALITTSVASRLADASERARGAARANAVLAELAQRFLSLNDRAAVLAVASEAIAALDVGTAHIGETAEAFDGPSPTDEAAARWALAHRDVAGRGATTMGGARCLYFASRAGHRGLVARLDGPLPGPSVVTVLRSILDDTADTLDRIALAAREEADRQRADATVMREALFASIGHDLRTPLAGLRAGLEELQASDPEQLAAVRADALRLEATLISLLEMARLQASDQPPAREVIDLTDTVAAALAALPRETRARVETTIAADTPLVFTHPVMLHHIVLNLIDNAAKYSDPSDPVTLQVTPWLDGGALLSVADRGPGIGDDAGDLFTLFRRGSNADHAPGSGVGLSVVDAFSRALGHHVSLANRSDGQGAIFTIGFRNGDQR